MKRSLKIIAMALTCVLLIMLSSCELDAVLNDAFGDFTVPNVDIGEIPEIGEGSSFQVHYIDVGQADAALVLCDGEAMLIDGGNREDSDLIYAYLKNLEVNHLSYVIGTHGHEDHIGGIAGGLEYATADTVYCSVTSYDSKAFSNFKTAAEKRGAPIEVPELGYTFELGSAVCQVLGPVQEFDDPNDTSIVLKISYGETSFLFTGDAEYPAETAILDCSFNIDCDVLKVGHHGSSTSTGYRWLKEASPEYAVISVGADNSYGHPHEETLSRLEDAEVQLYRTDLNGHIVCSSDGKDVTFACEKNAP